MRALREVNVESVVEHQRLKNRDHHRDAHRIDEDNDVERHHPQPQPSAKPSAYGLDSGASKRHDSRNPFGLPELQSNSVPHAALTMKSISDRAGNQPNSQRAFSAEATSTLRRRGTSRTGNDPPAAFSTAATISVTVVPPPRMA